MDIAYLRFANSILEPVWNREHVSHVQMTIAEDFGVEDRGRFYDAVGAMRDVIQNHALQVLALVGMGPPTGNHYDSIRDKKLEFFKAVRTADPEKYVRGQYVGFHDVKDVAPDSTTETYAAVELQIDNWRWSGVPFFIQAGKNLPVKASEVNVVFKRPPRLGIGKGITPEPNQLTLRIEPDAGRPDPALRQEGRRGGLRAGRPRGAVRKGPGRRAGALRAAARRRDRGPQRALHPAGRDRGDLADRPAADRTSRGPVHPYEPGTWGPKEADDLTRGVCSWIDPWLREQGRRAARRSSASSPSAPASARRSKRRWTAATR